MTEFWPFTPGHANFRPSYITNSGSCFCVWFSNLGQVQRSLILTQKLMQIGLRPGSELKDENQHF